MRKSLNKKEIKELNSRIEAAFKIKDFFGKKDKVVLEDDTITNGGVPVFFEASGDIVPLIKQVLEGKISLKRVSVDMGAIKFLVSGADVMRPGIVGIDEGIGKGEIVQIVDQQHGKPIAIGKSLWTSEEMKILPGGKAIKNLHWAGDRHFR